jgi:hypothetical protein
MLCISPLVRANSAVVNRNRDNEGAREQQVKELTTLLLTTSMVTRMSGKMLIANSDKVVSSGKMPTVRRGVQINRQQCSSTNS